SLLVQTFAYKGRVYDIPRNLVVIFVTSQTVSLIPSSLADLCMLTVDHYGQDHLPFDWRQFGTPNALLWDPYYETIYRSDWKQFGTPGTLVWNLHNAVWGCFILS
ncbi:hypothetical protein SARC_16719, partial [Sphaeroforma arctica JP610]